jgi:hypothetical protein
MTQTDKDNLIKLVQTIKNNGNDNNEFFYQRHQGKEDNKLATATTIIAAALFQSFLWIPCWNKSLVAALVV